MVLVWKWAGLNVSSNMIFPAGFLHKVLNHYFTNHNVYRSAIVGDDETVYTYIQRSLLMLLNAFAVFYSSNEPVLEQNIALSKEFNLDEVITNNKVFVCNILPILTPIDDTDMKTFEISSTYSKKQEVFINLCNHPVFHLFLPELSHYLVKLEMRVLGLNMDEDAIIMANPSERPNRISKRLKELKDKRMKYIDKHKKKYGDLQTNIRKLLDIRIKKICSKNAEMTQSNYIIDNKDIDK